jgi:hypothetical protein
MKSSNSALFSTAYSCFQEKVNSGLVYPQKPDVAPLTLHSSLLRVINRVATKRTAIGMRSRRFPRFRIARPLTPE